MNNLNEIYQKIKNETDSGYSESFNKTSSYFRNLLKNGNKLTEEDLDLLIGKQNNGIADAGQWGSCSKDQLNKIKTNWSKIYEIIKIGKSRHFTIDEYQNVRAIIKNCCEKDKIIVTNRIFAAFFPNEVSATCKEDDFKILTDKLKKLSDYPQIENCWLIDNYNFIDYCKKYIKISDNLPLPVFSWKLRDYLNKKGEIMEQKESNEIKGESTMERIEELENLLIENHNIILHGAPGTGKTHLAKDIAAQIIAGKNYSELSDEEKEQIGFCQFHPSYDYTDFVEGLRPVHSEDGKIEFDRKDGVFKFFCNEALENQNRSNKSIKELTEELENEDLLELFLKDSKDKKEKFFLDSKAEFYIKQLTDNQIIIKSSSVKKDVKVSKKNFVTLLNSGEEINQNSDVIRILNHITTGTQPDYYLFSMYKKFQEKGELIQIKNEIEKKYVFIIDEINRGELSKIFGELFYSIDPGYRGIDGKIKTQYANMYEKPNNFDKTLNSNDYGWFYIPDNVYIIGTMNDIDRSVESMDFAMRRRFTFVEITAEESGKNMKLPKNVVDIMTRINNKISDTEGLNSSYHIGGSYFLKKGNPITTEEDLKSLWELKLGPLVYEYLRGMDEDGSKYKEIENVYFGRDESQVQSEPENNASIVS